MTAAAAPGGTRAGPSIFPPSSSKFSSLAHAAGAPSLTVRLSLAGPLRCSPLWPQRESNATGQRRCATEAAPPGRGKDRGVPGQLWVLRSTITLRTTDTTMVSVDGNIGHSRRGALVPLPHASPETRTEGTPSATVTPTQSHGRGKARQSSGPSPGTGVCHCSVAILKLQACATLHLTSVPIWSLL